MPPEITEPHIAWVNQVLDERRPMTLEEGVHMPAGELWFDTRLVPLMDVDGRPYAVLGMSRDITELHRTQGNLHELTSTLEGKSQGTQPITWKFWAGCPGNWAFAPNYDEFLPDDDGPTKPGDRP